MNTGGSSRYSLCSGESLEAIKKPEKSKRQGLSHLDCSSRKQELQVDENCEGRVGADVHS